MPTNRELGSGVGRRCSTSEIAENEIDMALRQMVVAANALLDAQSQHRAELSL